MALSETADDFTKQTPHSTRFSVFYAGSRQVLSIQARYRPLFALFRIWSTILRWPRNRWLDPRTHWCLRGGPRLWHSLYSRRTLVSRRDWTYWGCCAWDLSQSGRIVTSSYRVLRRGRRHCRAVTTRLIFWGVLSSACRRSLCGESDFWSSRSFLDGAYPSIRWLWTMCSTVWLFDFFLVNLILFVLLLWSP